MRATLAAVAALIVVLVPAAPAAGGGPSTKNLQAQITSLKRQLNATNAKVKALETNLDRTTSVSFLAGAVAVCGIAATADALQGTWTYLDQLLAPTQTPSAFGAQTPVNDAGVCLNALRISRTQGVPPTVATFQALLTAALAGRIAPSLTPWWQLPG